MLSLQTPAGGQYSVRLSDGTKVYLNASSSLKYPVKFTGNERKVILTGEAYFEVKSNPDNPFVVESNMQRVRVLGTKFNVNAYSDEQENRTILLEGKVSVRTLNDKVHTYNLKPGQQSRVSGGGVKITSADIKAAVAWRDGYFSLENKSLDRILREVGRWYDIKIVYEGAIPQVAFYGDASRESEFTVILQLLSSAGVNYHLKDRVLYIEGK